MAQWTAPSHQQDPAQEAVMPLLNDLSVNIKLMQKMVRLIGTKNDTQEERRKFEEMSKESRGIIQQATRLMGRSTTLNKQMEDELVEYSRQFRLVMQQYISKCKKYTSPFKPQNINETDPLLASMNSKQFNPNETDYPYKYPQKQNMSQSQQDNIFDGRYMTQIKVHNEQRMLEEQDSKMGEIVTCLEDVNEMFEDLKMMSEAQSEPITHLENNVISTRDHVTRGKNDLLKAEKHVKKSRRNRCMLLFILLTALVALVCIIWAMKKT